MCDCKRKRELEGMRESVCAFYVSVYDSQHSSTCMSRRQKQRFLQR